jgi:hypothetical protein
MIKKEPPYAKICCKRCWLAKRDKCTCHCGGVHHKEGLRQHENEDHMVLKSMIPAYLEQIKDYRQKGLSGNGKRSHTKKLARTIDRMITWCAKNEAIIAMVLPENPKRPDEIQYEKLHAKMVVKC